MAVRCIKIRSENEQDLIIQTEVRVPKNGKTIIRKKPYKGGLCYRQKRKTGRRSR